MTVSPATCVPQGGATGGAGGQMIRFAGRACRLPMAPDVTAFEALLYDGRSAVTQIPEDRWAPCAFLPPGAGNAGRCYSFAARCGGRDPCLRSRALRYLPPGSGLHGPAAAPVPAGGLGRAGGRLLKPSELAGKEIGVFAGASLMDYGAGLGYDPQGRRQLRDERGLPCGDRQPGQPCLRLARAIDDHRHGLLLVPLRPECRPQGAGKRRGGDCGGRRHQCPVAAQPVRRFRRGADASRPAVCARPSARAPTAMCGERARWPSFWSATAPRRACRRATRGRLLHVETNTSGQTVNIALPSARAQTALLRSAYDRAGIDPDQLAFVEAHGTGTAAGDPVEAEALGLALGQRRGAPLPIGSVKTNIGHLEPARRQRGAAQGADRAGAGGTSAQSECRRVEPGDPLRPAEPRPGAAATPAGRGGDGGGQFLRLRRGQCPRHPGGA